MQDKKWTDPNEWIEWALKALMVALFVWAWNLQMWKTQIDSEMSFVRCKMGVQTEGCWVAPDTEEVS